MVEVQKVSKHYGALEAVSDISFILKPDEIVGFLGPNGAGKSTVLKMLSTFLAPTLGKILIDGLDVTQHALSTRRKIGYLSGDTPLYPGMRVDRFLQFCGKARGLNGKALRDSKDWVIEICGLSHELHKRISECSTGFRQRIGLGSALIHNPPILFLDEPTHGFDPLQAQAFRDLLRSLRENRVILFSTHITQEIAALADRVLIINNGHLLADDSPAELARQTNRPHDDIEAVFSHLVKQSKGVTRDGPVR